MVFVPILLLNMLIAMMGNTYAHVIEQSEKEWMKQVFFLQFVEYSVYSLFLMNFIFSGLKSLSHLKEQSHNLMLISIYKNTLLD